MSETNQFIIDDHKELAGTYLKKPKNENYYQWLTNQAEFLENITSISLSDVKAVYQENPQFLLSTYKGIHPIFYFCLSNNYDKVSFVLNKNIQDGNLKTLPSLGKAFSKEKKDTPLTRFCASKNLDKSLATIFLYLNRIDDDLISSVLKAAIVEDSQEVFKFGKSYIKEGKFQEICFSFLQQAYKNEMFLLQYLKKHNKLKNLEDLGIDLTYKKEEEKNYLSLYVANIHSDRNYYNPQGSTSTIKNNEIKFLKTFFANIDYLTKNKNINFNQSFGDTNLEKMTYAIIDSCEYISSTQKESYNQLAKSYAAASLSKQLKTKDSPEPKKFKI